MSFNKIIAAFTLIFAASAANALARSTPAPVAGERIVRSLDLNWRFAPNDKKGSEGRGADDADWQKINLPHTWNAIDAFDETPGYRRGVSWYRRALTIGGDLQGKRLSLYFEGANQIAEVYINGRLAGTHIGGYTAFSMDITELVVPGGSNLIAVRVDNSFNPDVPPLTADFDMYGGIYRDVWLIATNDVHFNTHDLASPGVQVSTPGVNAQSGTVRVQGSVSNSSASPANIEITSLVSDANGRLVSSVRSNVVAGPDSDIAFDHSTPPVPGPRLWSPDDPYLYSVKNVIRVNGRAVDTVTQPLGFRWYRFDAETGFYLNGRPLKLRGTNRHQDRAGLGNAVPDRLNVRDMQLIKETGFNFVRLAHYPQDPSVLDAADRLGLLIWEEIPIVNYITRSDAFTANSLNMVREMVRQHRNHPSIVLWGYMNEIYLRVPRGADDLYPATVVLAKQLDAAVRTDDPTRLTTIAFHGSEMYNKSGLADIPQVIGWNVYKGWYGGELKEFGEFIDDQHRRYPGRPLIISEYGANGDERLHSRAPRRFDSTTEYQRAFHESYLAQIDARPYISASALWSEFDFGSETRGETIPHVNQKGMFTATRVPKDVHYFYKANLSPSPVLHIAVNDQKYFAGPPEREQRVDIYSNLAEAELLINGVSHGNKQFDGSRKASWDVKLATGRNLLIARGMRGGKPVVDKAEVYFKPISAASPDIAINVGSNADYIDNDNTVWLADQAYIKGWWGFFGDKAKWVYSESTDADVLGTIDDPLFQTRVEGLTGYRVDVPDGDYTVELMFAETKFDAAGKRVFDISINGRQVAALLDLAKQAGRNRAMVNKYNVAAQNGITITFTPHTGDPVLSGIRVRRVVER